MPSPEDCRDGSYAVTCRTKPSIVQGRNSLEDDLDGARRLARGPLRAAPVCDEPRGSS